MFPFAFHHPDDRSEDYHGQHGINNTKDTTENDHMITLFSMTVKNVFRSMVG